MELTHNYKQQATFPRLRALFTQRIARFVTNNPDVFEAIARTGSPFGGPVTYRPSSLRKTQVSMDELARIQQQLQELTQQVARLHTSLGEPQRSSEAQPVEKARNTSTMAGKSIGIDRFRALQGATHSMA